MGWAGLRNPRGAERAIGWGVRKALCQQGNAWGTGWEGAKRGSGRL